VGAVLTFGPLGWGTWILVTGVALLIAGLRGRRVDDHPLCRRCGYDLVGNPSAEICTECGADLHRHNSVRIGHRRRRRALLAAGLVMTVPMLVLGGGLGVMWARGVDAAQYKPVWWLLRDGDDDAAAKELNRRLSLGSLNNADITRVVTHVLAVQADRTKAWRPSWGDFIENARAASQIADPQWHAYLNGAIDFTLEARQRVHRDTGVVLRVTANADRQGSRSMVAMNWRVADVRLGGVPLVRMSPGLPSSSTNVFFGADGSPRVGRYGGDVPPSRVPDGPHPVVVHLSGYVGHSRSAALFGLEIPYMVRREAEVSILPPGEPLFVRRTDDALRPRVRASVRHLTVGVGVDGVVRVNVAVNRPPIAMACDVVLRDRHGREWPMGMVAFDRGESKLEELSGRCAGLDTDTIHVVSRPTPDPLPSGVTDDLMDTQRSGETIVFEDVPVAWAPGIEPARGAATMPAR
jgi:hypothetical protein